MRFASLSLLAASIALASCAKEAPTSIFHDQGREAPQQIVDRPAYPGYGAAIGKQRIPWTVDSLVEDFIELNMTGEWDRDFPHLIRWEGPVRVALAGRELQAYRSDVQDLVDMIAEAAPGLDINLTDAPTGEITIRTAPRAQMKAEDESALCFITPYGLDWTDYLAQRALVEDEWAGLTEFEAMTVFIPAYSAPQVFRACFVEEVMQALGPSNDLYRLEDSGFNDDEVHSAPTAFDLLILRVLYDDGLRNNMSAEEARAASRRVLSRLVTDEGGLKQRHRTRYDKEFQKFHFFSDVLEDTEDRRKLITAALELSELFAEDDHRRGEALRSAAYFENNNGSKARAVEHARAAVAHFERTLPPSSARLARTRSDLAYFLILTNGYVEAVKLLDLAEPVLAAHAKEADLASVMRLRAIALAAAGRMIEARDAARDALAWAAYVFGTDSDALSNWRKEFSYFDILV